MRNAKKLGRAVLLSALLGPLLPPAYATAESLTPSQQRGLVFVNAHCSHCHSIYRLGASPLKIAPPFRTLHLRYPVESLQESLAEGIITGHPSMPEFRLDPGQVADVIAYLKSLEQ
jgi:cytochrome c